MIIKKLILFTTILILSFILTAGTASAASVDRNVDLILGQNQAQINGQSVTMSAPAKVINGRTLVPLRFISEAFGCDVEWDNKTRTAIVNFVDQIIEVPIGQNYVVINDGKVDVDVPGQLINGSTYVPLRFISESLGAKVEYDESTRAISITMRTYINSDKRFEMVLPADWVVDEETTEDVTIGYNNDFQSMVGFADEGQGIDVSNFYSFAEDCFVEFENKDEFSKHFQAGIIAIAAYKEEGLLNIVAYKLLDDGIYYYVFACPQEIFDDSIARQCEIVINSLEKS